MMNTLSVGSFEGMLADDFTYESHYVYEMIESKQAFLEYIKPRLQSIAQADTRIFAEMGMVSAYGERQPCVALAQYNKSLLVGLVLARVQDNKLSRLDLCIVPAPESADRSGEYPD
ncbi:hypothetical protein [Oleiagrimonas sp.]|jgi:hypothetical protein|uniref:hypothetical protein n=1 Tax=Oleiagrimonas sp. TaxID=2010330 RepID=UPI002609D926|nr:hypothetical protein [Oleiagrimonas sp.]MDA3913954.1 hypothetical protein [Oleiagrimonas sp.]